MSMLPYFLSSLLGWVIGHVSSLLDRHSNWLRLMNYPVGIAGAALGTMISHSLENFQNKFLLFGIMSSACALLLFRIARRMLVREGLAGSSESSLSL